MATDDMTREEWLEYWDNKLNDLAAEACSEGNRFVELPVSGNKRDSLVAADNADIFHPDLSLLYNKIKILIDIGHFLYYFPIFQKESQSSQIIASPSP